MNANFLFVRVVQTGETTSVSSRRFTPSFRSSFILKLRLPLQVRSHPFFDYFTFSRSLLPPHRAYIVFLDSHSSTSFVLCFPGRSSLFSYVICLFPFKVCIHFLTLFAPFLNTPLLFKHRPFSRYYRFLFSVVPLFLCASSPFLGFLFLLPLPLQVSPRLFGLFFPSSFDPLLLRTLYPLPSLNFPFPTPCLLL